jgi:hypothetical protein
MHPLTYIYADPLPAVLTRVIAFRRVYPTTTTLLDNPTSSTGHFNHTYILLHSSSLSSLLQCHISMIQLHHRTSQPIHTIYHPTPHPSFQAAPDTVYPSPRLLQHLSHPPLHRLSSLIHHALPSLSSRRRRKKMYR